MQNQTPTQPAPRAKMARWQWILAGIGGFVIFMGLIAAVADTAGGNDETPDTTEPVSNNERSPEFAQFQTSEKHLGELLWEYPGHLGLAENIAVIGPHDPNIINDLTFHANTLMAAPTHLGNYYDSLDSRFWDEIDVTRADVLECAEMTANAGERLHRALIPNVTESYRAEQLFFSGTELSLGRMCLAKALEGIDSLNQP